MPPRTQEFELEIGKSDPEAIGEGSRSVRSGSERRERFPSIEGVIPFPVQAVLAGEALDAGAGLLSHRAVGPAQAGLVEVTRALAAHLESETLLDAAVRGAMELIDCEGGFAAERAEGGLRSHRYLRPGQALPLERCWKVGEGLAGWVLQCGTGCRIEDACGDRRLDPVIAKRLGIRSALAVPIPDFQGRVSGVLVLHNRRGLAGFTSHDLEVLEEVARSASVALQNARAFEALRREVRPEAQAADHSRRLQALGQFAGGIAHDFNNFLTVVLGQTDLLLESAETPLARGELDEIREAALRARFLTRRLLAFSRKGSEEAEPIDTAEHVREVSRLLRRLVGGGIEIREELSESLPPVRMAPGQLDQILMNLVSNARDAMPEGGTVTLRSRAAPDAGGILLEVEDTGKGMDETTLRRIFEPYFTTKTDDGGTGLGLATVASIVRDAGGSVHTRSAPGVGTAFSIFLPSAGARRFRGKEEPVREKHSDPEPPTILLVEDEDSVRRLVRRVLQRRGYRVLEAENGARAVALVEDRRIPVDLLLTDVMLPDMGGIQLWQLLSEKVAGQRTIFMSGFLEDDLPQVDFGRNEVEFLPKPFAIKDLVGLVESVLGSK